MTPIRKFGGALLALSALTLTTPVLASSPAVVRRDAATTAALATIDQAQATLTAIQRLIDGINARNASHGAAPAGQ